MSQPPSTRTPATTADIVITCSCGRQMRAPASALGKMGRCSLCGRRFTATAENTAPAPLIEPLPEHKEAAQAPKPAGRIESLDQLRGYAIVGMIIVNFLGNFPVMPWFLDHQRDTFSYADTIAPLFVFVVGMGFRLSLKRRAEKDGLRAARFQSLKRYLVLLLVAIAFYGPDYTKDWWDALTEIALAGMLTLFLIDKPMPVRAAGAFGFLGAYMFFFLGTGYGAWLHEESMNGGPLGPLGGAFMLLFGTIAYDLLASDDGPTIVRWSLIWGIGLIAIAFAIWAIMPKDVPGYTGYEDTWPFAKRWGAAPFVCLSTGISFLTFLFFYTVVDSAGFNFPHLSIFGENPLVIYLVQYSLLSINGVYLSEAYTDGNLPTAHGAKALFVALTAFAVFYLFNYAVARRLHRDKVIIKL